MSIYLYGFIYGFCVHNRGDEPRARSSGKLAFRAFARKETTGSQRQRGRVYILDDSSFLTILSILLLSFLSFLILSVTRLLPWDTLDSPIPKCVPISFFFCLYTLPLITPGSHMIKCTRTVYSQGTSHIYSGPFLYT